MIDDFHISREEPPFWSLLDPGPWRRGIFVTYGNTIHTMSEVSEATLAHECVHMQQQMEYADGLEAYVKRYVSDPQFQYDQEVTAYQAEYRFLLEKKGEILASDEAERMADDLFDRSKYQIPGEISRDRIVRDIIGV